MSSFTSSDAQLTKRRWQACRDQSRVVRLRSMRLPDIVAYAVRGVMRPNGRD